MKNPSASYANIREINGVCIPLPIQTAYVRNFLLGADIPFSLPNVEITHANGFPILKKLLIDSRENISFCSILIFPTDRTIMEILKNVQGTTFIFCMENLFFSADELMMFLETRKELKSLTRQTII